jgi:hypothetical protein
MSTHRREEVADIVYEQVGLLERREVAAAWHGRPPSDVVVRIAPMSWRTENLFWEDGHT